MSLETATYLHQLNVANPAGSDKLQQGDDHLRLIKAVLKNTFPNLTGAMTLTQQFLNTTMPAQLVPFGVITAWYGDDSAVPAGWAVCNGQTVAKSDGTGNITVPDLRDRVIAGASTTNAEGSTRGQAAKTVTTETGGAHNHVGTVSGGAHVHGSTVAGHVLTIAEIPSHSHTIPGNPGGSADPSKVESGTGGAETNINTSSVGGGLAHNHNLVENPAAGTHSHGLAIDPVPAHGHAVTVNVEQATMALHYIMKI
jgi:hypothetical protein